MEKWEFQYRIAKEVLNTALKEGKAVCAVSCSGGKSTIAQHILNLFAESRPDISSVVITENNNALKEQFLDDIKNAHIPINFTYGEFTDSKNVHVRVGVAASLHKLKVNPGLLIIDEAHRHSFAERIQSYIKKAKPKAIIYLTGTPDKFIKENKNTKEKTKIVFISGSELQERGLYSGVTMDVFRTKDKMNPVQTVEDFLSHTSRNQDNTSKTLIACPTITYAEKMAQYLEALGKIVFLSTSKNDPKNLVLNESKKSKLGFIVTVGKCSLGYSDRTITCLADFRSSLNSLSTNFQLFARVLRQSSDDIHKLYIRVSNDNSVEYNKNVMLLHKLDAFLERHVFTQFDGSNLTLIPECWQNRIYFGSIEYAEKNKQNHPKVLP